MKTNKLVKLGIATFAVAVLGVVPAFTAQADTHVAEQPNTAQADTHVAEQPNTASKPVENGNPSDSEKPEVKPTEEAKPEAKSTANATETQPSDAPGGDATLNEEKHLPIRYVIELHFKYIGIVGEVEPTKTLTGTVNFGEDLTIDAPTFEGYRLERAYPKSLNISYDNLNNFGKTAGSEVYEIDETSKDREYTLTKEGDTIIAHRRLQYETLPLEKPNRSERTLHISFSYTGTPKIWPDGTRPLRRKYHSIDDGKRGITVTIKPGESFTLPKGEIDGYILEDITDSRHEEGRWGATTGNHYKPGETVPYEKFNFYPAVVDGVESDHISVSYSYYRPEKPSQPTEKPAPKPEVKPETKPSETPKPVTPAVPDQPQPAKPEKPVTPSTSRILANEIGSVQVRASEETLKNVSYIKVEETKSNSLTAKNYKAYDIRLYDANGKAVQPNGMVLVSLSAEKPVENVYYVSPDGALQALDFKQDADKVTFETNHFSIYAMTFKNMSVNHNGGSIQTPAAGSENPTTPTQNSNGADGTQSQSKPLKTKGEGGEKTTKTLPNTGENSSILTTLFGVLTLNAGLFSYRKKEK